MGARNSYKLGLNRNWYMFVSKRKNAFPKQRGGFESRHVYRQAYRSYPIKVEFITLVILETHSHWMLQVISNSDCFLFFEDCLSIICLMTFTGDLL